MHFAAKTNPNPTAAPSVRGGNLNEVVTVVEHIVQTDAESDAESV